MHRVRTSLANSIAILPKHSSAFVIVILLGLLAILWFGGYQYNALMGDDLGNVWRLRNGGPASSWAWALTETAANKYRPVANSVWFLETGLFGPDFRWYVYFNMVLEFANACMVSLLAWKISRKQLLIGLFAGIAALVSRFSYYNVLQATGMIEGLSLLLFLIMLRSAVNAHERASLKAYAWPILWYFLLIYTHERYVVVGAFLVIAILVDKDDVARWHDRLLIALLPVLATASNYALKALLLKTRFFEGTGGNAISFDINLVWEFLRAGSANMLGFNIGPQFLSGLNLTLANTTALGLAAVLTLSTLIVLVQFARRQICGSKRLALRDLALRFTLFVALFLPLLLSASITIRQEFRWLYAPYIVFLLAMAYMLGQSSVLSWVRWSLAGAVLVSAFGVDVYYRGFMTNVFFFEGLCVADSAKTNIIDRFGSDLAHHEVYFVTDVPEVKSYYFLGDTFVKLYTGNRQARLNYVREAKEIPLETLIKENLLAFRFDRSTCEVVDMTGEARNLSSSLPKTSK